MPVYEVMDREAVGMFEMRRYLSLNGLILEADGEAGKFKRRGVLKIPASDEFEHQYSFWKGCSCFEVEGDEIANFNAVPVPECDEEAGGIVDKHKQERQYILSIVQDPHLTPR